MEIITWTGQKVNKPEWMKHNPILSHTIKPKVRLDFATWFEAVRLRKDNDIETIKVSYLFPEICTHI